MHWARRRRVAGGLLHGDPHRLPRTTCGSGDRPHSALLLTRRTTTRVLLRRVLTYYKRRPEGTLTVSVTHPLPFTSGAVAQEVSNPALSHTCRFLPTPSSFICLRGALAVARLAPPRARARSSQHRSRLQVVPVAFDRGLAIKWRPR